MNRFVSKTLAAGMACAGLMAMTVSWPVAAEDDAIVAADKVVVAALAKADKVSADKWLDPDFTWIDSEGIMWAKTDAFRAELTPLAPGEKAALDEWQDQESSQANWEKHVANDMDQRVVSSYGGASPSKADRIAG